MKIQRYSVGPMGVRESEDGPWVRYEDYAALRDKFGRGPHLLTARDGSQALCGGPGVCPACEREMQAKEQP